VAVSVSELVACLPSPCGGEGLAVGVLQDRLWLRVGSSKLLSRVAHESSWSSPAMSQWTWQSSFSESSILNLSVSIIPGRS